MPCNRFHVNTIISIRHGDDAENSQCKPSFVVSERISFTYRLEPLISPDHVQGDIEHLGAAQQTLRHRLRSVRRRRWTSQLCISGRQDLRTPRYRFTRGHSAYIMTLVRYVVLQSSLDNAILALRFRNFHTWTTPVDTNKAVAIKATELLRKINFQPMYSNISMHNCVLLCTTSNSYQSTICTDYNV